MLKKFAFSFYRPLFLFLSLNCCGFCQHIVRINMGTPSLFFKQKLRKGLWSPEEDEKLIKHITLYGHGCWSSVPKLAGLQRCGKSCRLRWINYLRPDLKRGTFSHEEENLIIELHRVLGNRWSQIAAQLPGRTDNEIKNLWNSSLKRKLRQSGIDPSTHKPIFDVENNEKSKTETNSSDEEKQKTETQETDFVISIPNSTTRDFFLENFDTCANKPSDFQGFLPQQNMNYGYPNTSLFLNPYLTPSDYNSNAYPAIFSSISTQIQPNTLQNNNTVFENTFSWAPMNSVKQEREAEIHEFEGTQEDIKWSEYLQTPLFFGNNQNQDLYNGENSIWDRNPQENALQNTDLYSKQFQRFSGSFGQFS